MLCLICVVLLIILLLYVYFFIWSTKALPPGPYGIPILGYLPFLRPNTFIALQKLGYKYGPVFTVNLGLQTVVILHSLEALKEAFITQGDVFSGRVVVPYFQTLFCGRGIVFSEGTIWKHQRKISLKILRDFGFGKAKSKTIIKNEIGDIEAIIDAEDGKPILIHPLLSRCTANIVSAFCVGERPAHWDKQFQTFIEHGKQVAATEISVLLPLLFPFIAKIPFCMQILDTRFSYHVKEMQHYCKRKVLEHVKNLNSDNYMPNDYVDSMLQLKEEESKKPDYVEELYLFSIVENIVELIQAGTDTTATTLSWLLFLLAVHPEVQAKMQEEIDLVSCDKNIYDIEFKQYLPYSSAVIDESSRFATIAPIGVTHRTTKSTWLFGYQIPRNTLVISNLYAIHHDKSYWEYPDLFHPEHFLTADGKYRSRDHLVPFSSGVRVCLGESLARMEIICITLALVKRYDISCKKIFSAKQLKKMFMGNDGAVNLLSSVDLQFKRRSID